MRARVTIRVLAFEDRPAPRRGVVTIVNTPVTGGSIWFQQVEGFTALTLPCGATLASARGTAFAVERAIVVVAAWPV